MGILKLNAPGGDTNQTCKSKASRWLAAATFCVFLELMLHDIAQ